MCLRSTFKIALIDSLENKIILGLLKIRSFLFVGFHI